MHDPDWWNALVFRSHRSPVQASPRPIQVLMIEDNPADTRKIQELLSNVQDMIELSVVTHLAAGLEQLGNANPDIVLVNLELAGSQGLGSLIGVRTHTPTMAVIAITSIENEAEGIEALQSGAQDYLVKEQLDSKTLQRAIRYAVERHHTETALRESEERFRAIFAQAAVGLNFVDTDGRFQRVNEKFCEIVGYRSDELLGRSFIDLTHPDDAQEDWASFQRLLSGQQEHYTIEKRFIHKNGSIVWVSKTTTKAKTNDETPLRCLSVVQDISPRKFAERDQLHLAAIIASSDDAIFSKTLEGILLSWNAAAERIYGYTADEVVGQSVTILFPPGYEDQFDRIMTRIRRGEPVSHLETKRVRKDGKLIDIALTVSPIKNAAGEIIGASSIARDITTLVWLQNMRQESEQRLRQLTENISEVVWLSDVEQGQMLYVSAACSTVWGIRREQLYEQPASLLDMIHPDDRDRVMEAGRRHPHGGFDEEYRVIRPDGEERWVHSSTFPIRSSTGEIYRVAGIAKDVTDYKRLMATEHEQRLLAEAMRDIANALNSTRDMPEVLDRLLIHIEQVVPHDAAEIMLVKNGMARVVRSRGYDSRGLQVELEALEFPVEETPNLRSMSETRKPLIIPDVLDAAADTPALNRHRPCSGAPARACRSVPEMK